MIIFGIASALLALAIYFYRKYKRRVLASLMDVLIKGVRLFNSLGKVLFLVLASFALLVLFVSLMLGMIQDFLAHEFSQFDEVTSYLVLTKFGPEWHDQMQLFAKLGTIYLYGPLLVITSIWIMFRGRNKGLSFYFFSGSLLAGNA